MKKVGICTVFTGFNYGSALQATATKAVLKKIGYEGIIYKLSGSIISGRDIRLKKMFSLGFNLMFHIKDLKKIIKSYKKNSNKILSSDSKEKFFSYYQEIINPVYITEKKLKVLSCESDYAAFLCGSDQVWNSSTYYVDPFYYLTFAPYNKRVAFSPSFGRDFIPKYNKKKIRKKIMNIPHLSVREDSGKKLIFDLTKRESEVLVDPTLLLTKYEWQELLALNLNPIKEEYILAYFLDSPSGLAKQSLDYFASKGYKIVYLPYMKQEDWIDECLSAGPKEFLELLSNAKCICTDSFHGAIFSINFQKQFCVFEREYGVAANQSARITSILNKLKLMSRFNIDDVLKIEEAIDFSYSEKVLEEERLKSINYLLKSIN